MIDRRFHGAPALTRLGAIAEAIGLTLDGQVGSRMIDGLAHLDDDAPDALGFCVGGAHRARLATTRLAAVLVSPALADLVPAGVIAITTTDPAGYFALAGRAMFPERTDDLAGIHPTAVVADDAAFGRDCVVGPFAVIGAGVSLGDRVVVAAHAVIGPGVAIGADARIGVAAAISCAVLGNRVTVKPGARIGQSGFGFVLTARGLVRSPQLGRVVIGDDVEIGANSCIDRGALGDTVIGAGTKIDNLVQIGHNVSLGSHVVLAAQVGLSGSSRIEDGAMLGGQSGVADHLTVGARAMVAAQSGVARDVPPAVRVGGSPAIAIRDHHRQNVWLAKQAVRGTKRDD
jgi:UDP-3-O-[3-hydroxymyristoyl] glucosamine N-acyltransferase